MINILDQYIDRKPIKKVKVKGYDKKVKVLITRNYCECHPETCSHWGYTFRAKGITWGSDNYKDYKQIKWRLHE